MALYYKYTHDIYIIYMFSLTSIITGDLLSVIVVLLTAWEWTKVMLPEGMRGHLTFV